jgi:hypothetical protein
MGATIKDDDILTMDLQKGFSPESIFNAQSAFESFKEVSG